MANWRRKGVDLRPPLAGGGRAGAGPAVEVCASGEPGVAGKKGSDLFSAGPAPEHDHRFAIVLADSAGAHEGAGGERYRTSVIGYLESMGCAYRRFRLTRHLEVIECAR